MTYMYITLDNKSGFIKRSTSGTRLRSISEKMLIMFSFFSTSTVASPKMNEFNAALAFSL